MSVRFSVLIPCHEPDPRQLRRALESVRRQLDGAHEVLVADDLSSWDCAARVMLLAREFGARLVRNGNAREWGGVATHNVLLEEAKGDVLHVLHPDDWVLEGFYTSMGFLLSGHGGRGLAACQHLLADHEGGVWAAPCVPGWRTPGDRWGRPLHEGNPLAVAACVFRRAAYREVGGWDERLVHCGDWEYWVRLAERCGAASLDWPLAVYRHHPANHTSRLMRTAENLRDYLRLAEVVSGYAPRLHDPGRFRAYVAARARNQAEHFRGLADEQAEAANRALAEELGGVKEGA